MRENLPVSVQNSSPGRKMPGNVPVQMKTVQAKLDRA
jgi:hypothetical protein